MTNPKSYTDEQVKHLVNLCSTGPTQAALRHLDVAEALEFLLTDRQRLQADSNRLEWLEKHMCGASDSERYLPFRIYWGDGRGIRKAIDAARATPNETKETKS